MGIHQVGSAAAVKSTDSVVLIASMNPEIACLLRELLAKAIHDGVGEPYRDLWQLLKDSEAALHEAFRDDPAPRLAQWPKVQILPRVCMIPDCGCTGLAHP